MPEYRPLTDYERAHVGRNFNPRFGGNFSIPVPRVSDAPRLCILVNEQWFSHIIGVLDVLDQPDAWRGTESEIEDARAQIRALIADIEYCEGDLVSIINMRIVDCDMEVQYSDNPGVWVYAGTLANCGGGGGTSSDYPPISFEFEIELHDHSKDRETVYDGDPAGFRPELDTWTSDLDAALCLAIRSFVEAAAAAMIASIQGETRRNAIIGIAVGVLGGLVGFLAPPSWIAYLGYGIGFAAPSAVVGNVIDNNAKINALQDGQTLECVTQLIYAGLMGTKPTLAAWQAAATGYTFPADDVNFVQDAMSELMQGTGTFIPFLDLLGEMTAYSDLGLLGNDCNGDYSACTSWVHTVYAPDFAAFGTVSDGVYNASEEAWEPAETGAVTEVVSLDVSVASGPSTSITGIEMMTRRVGSFTNRSSIDINSDRVYLGLPSTAQDWVGNDSISPEKTGVTNLLFRAAKDGDSGNANIFLYAVRIYGNGQNPFA